MVDFKSRIDAICVKATKHFFPEFKQKVGASRISKPQHAESRSPLSIHLISRSSPIPRSCGPPFSLESELRSKRVLDIAVGFLGCKCLHQLERVRRRKLRRPLWRQSVIIESDWLSVRP